MKRTILITIFFLTIIACNKNSEQDLRNLIENKPWSRDNQKGMIPVYYKKGVEYIMFPKDNKKLKNIRLDLYLDNDSPDNPKENSLWSRYAYYKISNDTLYLQNIDDGKINIKKITVLKDTTIGIIDYHRIELTYLIKEKKYYRKGLTFKLISKK